MTIECRACGLINEDNATKCDCGNTLKGTPVSTASTDQTTQSSRGQSAPLVIPGAIMIVAGLAAAVFYPYLADSHPATDASTEAVRSLMLVQKQGHGLLFSILGAVLMLFRRTK